MSVAFVFSVLFYLLGEQIIMSLTSIKEVQKIAINYLPWLILLPILAAPSYLLDGVFIGATKVKIMQNAMLISVLLVYFPVWFYTQELENNGLWIALLTLYIARGITSTVGFMWITKTNKWLD